MKRIYSHHLDMQLEQAAMAFLPMTGNGLWNLPKRYLRIINYIISVYGGTLALGAMLVVKYAQICKRHC